MPRRSFARRAFGAAVCGRSRSSSRSRAKISPAALIDRAAFRRASSPGVRPDRLRQQNVLPAQPSRPRFGEVHIPEAGDAVNVRITVAGPDVGDQIVPQKIECEQRRPDPERVGETSLCECGKIAAQKRPSRSGPESVPVPYRACRDRSGSLPIACSRTGYRSGARPSSNRMIVE